MTRALTYQNVMMREKEVTRSSHSEMKTCRSLHFQLVLCFLQLRSLEKPSMSSVRNRVDIKLPINDRTRVRAHCAEGCPWNLYASWDSRVKSFVVKTYYGGHTCQKEWKVSNCTARWIAGKYLESFRVNDKMSITSLSRTIQKD